MAPLFLIHIILNLKDFEFLTTVQVTEFEAHKGWKIVGIIMIEV